LGGFNLFFCAHNVGGYITGIYRAYAGGISTFAVALVKAL